MSDDKKTCPFCDKEILAIAKKCRYCGKWLIQEENSKEQQESIEPQKTIACPFCGEQIADDANQCPICGEILPTEHKTNKVNKNTKICQFCCAEIPKDAQKCTNCGEWLNEEDRPSNKIWGKIKGCGCLIIIIIILIIMLPWIIAGGIVTSLPEEKPDIPDGYEETTDWHKDFSPAEKMLYGYPVRYTYPNGAIVDLSSENGLTKNSCSKEAINKINQYCFNPDFKTGYYRDCRDEIIIRYCNAKIDLPDNTEDADIVIEKYYNIDKFIDMSDVLRTFFSIYDSRYLSGELCEQTTESDCQLMDEIVSKCNTLKRKEKLDCVVNTMRKDLEDLDVVMKRLQKEAHYNAL